MHEMERLLPLSLVTMTGIKLKSQEQWRQTATVFRKDIQSCAWAPRSNRGAALHFPGFVLQWGFHLQHVHTRAGTQITAWGRDRELVSSFTGLFSALHFWENKDLIEIECLSIYKTQGKYFLWLKIVFIPLMIHLVTRAFQTHMKPKTIISI